MRTWITLALCSLTLPTLVKAQQPVEIADGRIAADLPDLSVWLSMPVIQQAFGAARTHWRAQDSGYEEDTRVLAVANGAFTQPDAEQRAILYLMSLWPRCCPKMGLAILEGDRLVRNVAFEGVAQELSALPDLDGDGRHELALVGEFGMGGQTSRSLTLVAFGAEGLVERGGASLYDSDCAATGDNGSTAARVLALPGPTFVAEQYTATCEAEAWQSTGAPEPLELYPTSTTYVDLSAQ